MSKMRHEYSYTTRRAIRHKIYFIIAFISLLLLLQTAISHFVAYSLILTTDSMSPTLSKNDCILVRPIEVNNEKSRQHIERGMLLVLEPRYPETIHPIGQFIDTVVGFFTFQQIHVFSNSHRISSAPVMRRIIGLPGDTVYVNNFVVYIKPAHSSFFLTEFELTEEPYDVLITSLPSNWNTSVPFSGTMQEITLGEDDYFVMSDNRMEYTDSRFWGAIPASYIQGKAVFRYFPLNDISLL